MKVKFWGVRGSIPAPGKKTVRYGGNTPCVQVIPSDDAIIIIDAGTGIRKLGKSLMADRCGRGEGNIHLLISHTHWDHIQGLPFFAPSYQEGNKLTIYARENNDAHLRVVLNSATDDPYFPIPFDAVHANVTFRELLEGQTFDIGVSKITCVRLNHPWIALGYRVDEGDRSFCYISDTAPFDLILLEHDYIPTAPKPGDKPPPEDAKVLDEMREQLVEVCRGADFMVFDTMFTMEEYQQRPHWGHSAPVHACEIARAAGIGRIALYHHDPRRTDDEMDALLEATQKEHPDLEITAATEGEEVEV